MTDAIKLPENATALLFRHQSANWYAGMHYATSGSEAVVFSNVNADTSWIFRTANPTAASSTWNDVTPSMQIKN
jgi:hypothetical protein